MYLCFDLVMFILVIFIITGSFSETTDRLLETHAVNPEQ